MPYKFVTDKIPMPKEKDRRIKLTNRDRMEIKEVYGHISQRKLAELYGVSRRLIQFIGNPDSREQNLLRRAENGGSMQYYDKDKHTKAVREHRQYKQKVIKEMI